jgi:Ca-activated chloride channel family protein
VSFGAPLVLLALLALPVLALIYLRSERDRRAAAATFASPALQPSVAPRRPGWRRHVPLAVMGVALAALVVAAARPQRTVAVPIERASIMLATDISGSMTATDVQPNRLTAAKAAEFRFIASVPKQVNVGVMAFNQTPRVLQNPTRDRTAVSAAISHLTVHGGTAAGEAIATATQVLNRAPGVGTKRPPAAIVLLSDGASTSGRDPVAAAQEARKLKIPIYTVALGTPSGVIQHHDPQTGAVTSTEKVPPDSLTLQDIARDTGGQFFAAPDSRKLQAVYANLGTRLAKTKEKRQVTSAFAGGALVLLLAGAGFGLTRSGRLP